MKTPTKRKPVQDEILYMMTSGETRSNNIERVKVIYVGRKYFTVSQIDKELNPFTFAYRFRIIDWQYSPKQSEMYSYVLSEDYQDLVDQCDRRRIHEVLTRTINKQYSPCFTADQYRAIEKILNLQGE